MSILLSVSMFFMQDLNAQVHTFSPKCISGIYPSLAYFNKEGECGTGAVVPWADRLWVVTYGPHCPFGSTDKLYEITKEMHETIRPESVGGTPADRMIHRESNQLFIGPYVIDSKRNVRVIDTAKAVGRYTGIARSLKNPLNEVVIATMEQGFFSVNVKSLATDIWFKDGNELKREGADSYQRTLVKGVHGKGFYSGQGVYVYSNNGEGCPEALVNPRIEAGSLSEYDGKSWRLVRRNQFTEITGPCGIYGSNHPDADPIWALGWDYKSIIIGVRDAIRGWRFFRAPKASNSYDGAHGWNTEWPRIRNVEDENSNELLMTMHGMFWHFPKTFSWNNTAGIRPMTNYLKVIGDFCSWNGRLVFGCDDSALSEFLNKRKAKGEIAGPGQSQSNLWFTSTDRPGNNGTSDAAGSVWEKENVVAGSVSEPYLLAGWNRRTVWINNEGNDAVNYQFEVDKDGRGDWSTLRDVVVEPHASNHVMLDDAQGEWIRVKVDKNTKTTVSFVYGDTRERIGGNDDMFNGISSINDEETVGGQLSSLGCGMKRLGILANRSIRGSVKETGYYELDGDMNLNKVANDSISDYIRSRMRIPSNVVKTEKGSYLIIDDSGRRWRLPLGEQKYTELMKENALRLCREVSTERDLFNLAGTFYELPAENADGFEKIRPISTHRMQINDYCSYRGMLVMTGLDSSTQNAEHIYTSSDGKCRVWAGAVDDLWKMGKPVGEGGPWADSRVKAGAYSDPYLIANYDQKILTLSHQSKKNVTFTVEMDPTGEGVWMKYATYTVKPGQKFTTNLPSGNTAHWIRFSADSNTKATAWLEYK